MLQVIKPQAPGSCPVLRVQATASDADTYSISTDDTAYTEQHLIPWAPSIVQCVDHATKRLHIIPTPGLLELGRQQGLLQRLKPELEALGKPPSDSLAKRLGQRYMPTKKQLVAAGRQDLVKLVMAAGGFISVAQLLGLRARRRPEGMCCCSHRVYYHVIVTVFCWHFGSKGKKHS